MGIIPKGLTVKKVPAADAKPQKNGRDPKKLSAEVKAAIKAVADKERDAQKVRVDDTVPNDWNPNVMAPAMREKVLNGIKQLLELVGRIPPIVIRPHPTRPGKWQIIDGFHRWDIYRELGIEMIDAIVLNVSDAVAMELTSALNYNRGEPDPDHYALYLKRYLETSGKSLEEAAKLLPETADEMQQILEAYDIEVEHLNVEDEEDDEKVRGKGDGEALVELKFIVYKPQAEVIEAELARIGSLLRGKNVRGRALELICANNALTPLESFETSNDEETEDEKPSEVSDTKARLKKRATDG